MPANASLPTPAQASRPLEVSVILLPIFLSGFLLARFAAPLFKFLPACTFRQVAGVPCPSCGATRAGLALAQGDLIAALSYNPLFVIGLGILFGWSVYRVFQIWSGKAISSRLVKKSTKFKIRQRLRWLAAGAIVLNWLYLIVTA
jgi:hypothetical protein